MSTDALLTLAAAVIAILTLLSPEGRDDLRLRVTPFAWSVGIAAFLILICIKLSPVWIGLGLPVLADWRWGFDPETASFVTIAAATAVIVFRVATMRLHPRRIELFARLAERLLFAGKCSELLFLLERHFTALQRLVESQHMTSRLRRWLKPDRFPAVFFDGKELGGVETLEEWKARQRKWTTRGKARLAGLLPDHEDRQARARRLLERMFFSQSFVEYVGRARPDFALRVLDLEVAFFRETYVDTLVGSWMRNPTSVLYEETKQNQYVREHHR